MNLRRIALCALLCASLPQSGFGVFGVGDTVFVMGDINWPTEYAQLVEQVAKAREMVKQGTELVKQGKKVQAIMENPRRVLDNTTVRKALLELGGEFGDTTVDLMDEVEGLQKDVRYAERAARRDPHWYTGDVFKAYKQLDKAYVEYQAAYDKMMGVDSKAREEIRDIEDSMGDSSLSASEVSALQLRLDAAESARKRAVDEVQTQQLRVLAETAARENEEARVTQEAAADVPAQRAELLKQERAAQAESFNEIYTTVFDSEEIDVELEDIPSFNPSYE